MNWEIGTKFKGFTVTNVRKSAELNGTMVELTHDVSGAPVAWLDNGAQNKLFSAAFKTLPEDSTGVFHILEHTVLCGSDKYPVHEPFVELLKSSMNTFLNAMTFQDKTMYPVSSRNDQDFLNLVEVYLDAVFKPNLLKNQNIFRQEGWHMEENDGELSYKGVVFNEMKGAMSNSSEVAGDAMQALLFPDNCYAYNSGGDPDVIPSLTYEQYVAMYHRYYHPSNCRVYLDGAIPVEKVFDLLDAYLSGYGRQETIPEIVPQKPVSAEKTVPYAVGEEDDAKAQFALGGVICGWQDRVKVLAMDVLEDYLTDSNDSPLKRALLTSGLGQDLIFSVNDNVFQPWYMIRVTGADQTKTKEIETLITETLRKEAQGMDHAELHAIINRKAFNMKCAKEPAALIRCIDVTSSWMYGGDVMQYLTCDDVIAALRAMADGDGFERLVQEVLLEGKVCRLTLVPSTTYAQEKREEEQRRLQAIWDGMDENAKDAVRAQQAELLTWQQTPDTPEQVATIPVLTVEDVDPNPTLIATEVKDVNGVKVITHPIPSGGIVCVSMYFDLIGFELKELTRLSHVCALIGELPAADMSVKDIQRELHSLTGGFSISVSPYGILGKNRVCRPMIQAHFSALKENLGAAWALVQKLITETHYEDDTRIAELAEQMAEGRRLSRVSGGDAIGRMEVLAPYSASAAASEAINGESAIRYTIDWPKNLKAENDKMRAVEERVGQEVFCRARMTLSLTSDKNVLDEVDVNALIAPFPEGEKAAWGADYTNLLPDHLGITIPAQISYACAGNSLGNVGREYDGSLTVTAQILTYKYLWDQIRVQGGAYGCGFRATDGGLLTCHSYRDPSPARSLGIYAGIGDFLRAFCASDERIDKYVISAVSDTDPLLAPEIAGMVGDQRYLMQVTDDHLREQRAQMLATTREQILSWAEPLEKAFREGAVCVVGHAEALKGCEGLNIASADAQDTQE